MRLEQFDYDIVYRDAYGNKYFLKFYTTQYESGNTLLACNCTTDGTWWEPYAIISKNFCGDWHYDDKREIFIDVNNIGDNLYQVLIDKGIIRVTGIKMLSGYCEYPLAYINEHWYKTMPKKGGLY